ncbi:MAG: molybdopterin molybdotransferase MoeA [Bacteroidales bacterium]|jgi:molybdopterin molybdotransferase
MYTLHEALDILKKNNFTLPAEEVDLKKSVSRILCEDVYSDINIPPFDKSAMDGYACRSEDLSQSLEVIGTLYAGSNEIFRIGPGTCVKIMTGAPVPEGADTVIIQEDTTEEKNNRIRCGKAASKTNICKSGEDVKKGDLVLSSGTFLLPHHIAVLASAGKARVKVSGQPRISVLATGSELVEPDSKPGPAQIRNSNAYQIIAQLQSMNLTAKYQGIAVDDKESVKHILSGLLVSSDMVIVTGGASAGDHDHIPQIFRELDLKLQFTRLAIQPGKPVSFAKGKNKFCFGLSGNPVSSLLQFEILVKPFLFHIMGSMYSPSVVLSEIADPITRKKTGRLKFFPVRFNSSGQAEEIGFNGSAHIAGLINADGFGIFPKGCETLNAGDKIEILLIK